MNVKKTKDVKFKKKTREPQGSKYDEILDSLRDLKTDEALILTPPKGMTVQSMKTRIWSAMYRALMLEDKRYYSTRSTSDGKLAIMVKMK